MTNTLLFLPCLSNCVITTSHTIEKIDSGENILGTKILLNGYYKGQGSKLLIGNIIIPLFNQITGHIQLNDDSLTKVKK
jgi:hypothetical protein